jgi:hypothetical protein
MNFEETEATDRWSYLLSVVHFKDGLIHARPHSLSESQGMELRFAFGNWSTG